MVLTATHQTFLTLIFARLLILTSLILEYQISFITLNSIYAYLSISLFLTLILRYRYLLLLTLNPLELRLMRLSVNCQMIYWTGWHWLKCRRCTWIDMNLFPLRILLPYRVLWNFPPKNPSTTTVAINSTPKNGYDPLLFVCRLYLYRVPIFLKIFKSAFTIFLTLLLTFCLSLIALLVRLKRPTLFKLKFQLYAVDLNYILFAI